MASQSNDQELREIFGLAPGQGDNGILEFGATEYSQTENGLLVAAIKVLRRGPLTGSPSATIALRDGTAVAGSDYLKEPISVQFLPGEVEKTITIPLVDDAVVEDVESLTLTLQNPKNGAGIGPQATATLKVLDNDGAAIIESRPSVAGSPLPIDSVDVFLPPGGEVLLEVTVTVPAEGGEPVTSVRPLSREPRAAQTVSLPLDVFLLQDLSGSFEDDIDVLQGDPASGRAGLAENLVTQLQSLRPDTTFGLGSFVDKPIGFFGDAADGDYVYRLEQPQSLDGKRFQQTVQGLTTRVGGDVPESQLEALLLLARQSGTTGFRSGARRVVVVSTDAPYHQAGDFLGAPPNNGDGVSSGSPQGTGEDYPSVQQVKNALIEADLLPIFAVTEDELATYRDLVDDSDGDGFGFGSVVQLERDSSNLTKAITEGLGNVGREINIFAISDEAKRVKEILPAKFTGVQAGETKKFVVRLQSDGLGSDDSLILRALGYGDIKVNIIQDPRLALAPSYIKQLQAVEFISGGSTEGNLNPGVDPNNRRVGFKVFSNPPPDKLQNTRVVIHGLNDDSDTRFKDGQEDGYLDNVARAWADKYPNDRVLFLDWREASNNDRYREGIGALNPIPAVAFGAQLKAGTWITPVAEYAVKALASTFGIGSEVAKNNLYLAGHSLGSLVASEMGRIYRDGFFQDGKQLIPGNQNGVKAFFALDPPSELNGKYDLDGRTSGDQRPESFSAVANFSRGFVGSKSLAGNQVFAASAKESIQIDYGGIQADAGEEHTKVVRDFSRLIDVSGGLDGLSSLADDVELKTVFGDFQSDTQRPTLLPLSGEKPRHDATLVIREGNFTIPDRVNLVFGRGNKDEGNQDELIYGTSKDDRIDTNFNDDILTSAGNDEIRALAGNDAVWGGGDNDTIYGAEGNDTINGEQGDDLIFGGADQDKIFGARGNDTVLGGDGDDDIEGNDGSDSLFGNAGNDTIQAGADSSSDYLDGGQGNDFLRGENGDDTLIGGLGQDTMEGGFGSDVFILSQNDGNTDRNQADIITDFGNGVLGLGGRDQIGLSGGLTVDSITLERFDQGFLGVGGKTAIKVGGQYLAILQDAFELKDISFIQI